MKSRGFSLMELSIVLIILGLLVVTITGSTTVINNAKLNRLISETESFKKHLGVFIAQFDSYPGDFKEAYNFFGVAAGCNNSNVNVDNDGCNGNGNNIIDWEKESYRVHQHLYLANIIPDFYDGVTDLATSIFNENLYHPPYPCSTAGYSDMGINCHQLGSKSDMNGAGLTPRELRKIDIKIDDTIPTSGNVRLKNIVDVVTSDSCGDATGYQISKTALGCNLLYNIDSF